MNPVDSEAFPSKTSQQSPVGVSFDTRQLVLSCTLPT